MSTWSSRSSRSAGRSPSSGYRDGSSIVEVSGLGLTAPAGPPDVAGPLPAPVGERCAPAPVGAGRLGSMSETATLAEIST